MKYIFTPLIVFLMLSFACCAQTRTATIPHAYAFYNVTIPGALQVDENGNPINNFIINRFVYFETKGRQPLIIQSVNSMGKAYKFSLEAVGENNVIAGNDYSTNLPVKIKAAKANRLWKISYAPISGKDTQEPLRKISIRGNAGGKAFKLLLPKDVQLAGPLMY